MNNSSSNIYAHLKFILKKYADVLVISFFIIYMIFYSHLENIKNKHYMIIHSSIDDLIPFNEYFIIPYLFWFLYVMFTMIFFYFKDKNEFYKYIVLTFTGMGIYIAICMIMPNGTDLRPNIDTNKNMCSLLVTKLYSLDTCTNTFPSIHVYNSLSTHIAITHSKYFATNNKIKLLSFITCISVCLSTLFLKQHSIIDLIASLIIIYIPYSILYIKPDKILIKQRHKDKAYSYYTYK